MIDNLPLIHEDELLYSLLARYHRVSGNQNFKDTLSELFGRDTIVPVVDLPCNLEYLAKKLPHELGINSNKLIVNQTIFPVYSPFMTVQKRNELLNIMKHENGNLIKFKIGLIAGSICRKNGLYYCPECAKTELNQYGEAYIHRSHQIQGVYVCEKHSCILHEYPISNNSRLEFATLQESNLVLRKQDIKDDKLKMDLTFIAKECYSLLNDNHKISLNIDCIHELYLKELKERGYLTTKGFIRQKDVLDDFANYYGTTLLAFLESELNESNQYNWLKLITRQKKRAIHPIRHLLFIGFLFGGIQGFLEIHKSEDKGIYGAEENMGLCLNPVCEYFQKPSVTNIKITADYKTREPVLTFTCQCGFSYSRKEKGDAFKIGTIKNFGHVWESALIDAIHFNKSLRAIAKQMKCDCKTVVKYAEKLGIKHLINSHMSFKNTSVKSNKEKIDHLKYKNDVLNLIKDNPFITRKEVRNILTKQYIWLYRNDREWYEENLPRGRVRKGINKSVNEHWEKIDEKILILLEKEYDYLIAYEKPVRITLSILGRRINKLAYLEKKLDKMPKTNAYINMVTETVEEFRRRRVEIICRKLIDADEPLIEWKISRMAGLRDLKIINEVILNITNNIM